MNTEPMNTELLWQRLQKDWQAAQPTVDASALVRQIHREHRHVIACLTVEIVAAFAITGLFAYWMFTNQGAITPLAVLLAVLWIGVFTRIWNRRGTWRAQGANTRALLCLVERRARAGIRQAWLTAIGVWVIFAVALPWEWHSWLYDTQDVLGWIFQVAFVVAVAHIWAFRHYRRQRRKLQRARVLLEQLSHEDKDP